MSFLKKPLIVAFCLLTSNLLEAQAPFSLSDSRPISDLAKARFLANYGVHSDIEPKLAQADRPLREAILPLLRSNPKKAIELIQRSESAKANPAFLNVLGNLYYQLGDYAQAESALKASLSKFPSFRRSWRTLGLVYIQRADYQAAIEPFLKVIELGGSDAQSYGLLAYAYLNQEKYESSLSAYRMARMFRPDSVDFRRGQAECLMRTHQEKAAIALFDELLQEHPNDWTLWIGQANAYLTIGQNHQAIANLQLVVDGGHEDDAISLLLGDLFLTEGLSKLALNRFLQWASTTSNPNSDILLKPLNSLLARIEFEAARNYLKVIKDNHSAKLNEPQQLMLKTAEAQIELEQGDRTRAKALLDQIIERDPLNGRAFLLLGDFYLGEAAFEEAEFHFERAQSIDATEIEGLIGLGRLEVQRRRLPEAVTYLRAALSKDPRPNLKTYLEAVEASME